MRIDVRSNTDQIIKSLNQFERQFAPRALNTAVNKTGTKVASVVRRDVAKQAGMTQSALKKRGFFASFRSSLRTMTFTMITKWGAIPLKDFNPKQTAIGVAHKAWGKATINKGAFKVDKLGGHVFARKTNQRLPIVKQYGPIPARIAAGPETEKEVAQVVRDRLPKELSRALRGMILRGLGRI